MGILWGSSFSVCLFFFSYSCSPLSFLWSYFCTLGFLFTSFSVDTTASGDIVSTGASSGPLTGGTIFLYVLQLFTVLALRPPTFPHNPKPHLVSHRCGIELLFHVACAARLSFPVSVLANSSLLTLSFVGLLYSLRRPLNCRYYPVYIHSWKYSFHFYHECASPQVFIPFLPWIHVLYIVCLYIGRRMIPGNRLTAKLYLHRCELWPFGKLGNALLDGYYCFFLIVLLLLSPSY